MTNAPAVELRVERGADQPSAVSSTKHHAQFSPTSAEDMMGCFEA